MSVRKRIWTASGEVREAWICDYADAQHVRRLKTFDKKKDAVAFQSEARQQILTGTHVPDSASKTITEAGDLWIKSAKAAGLERATVQHYEELLKLHIKPFIGGMKLSQITVPVVRAFEDKLREEGRSPSMVARVVAALGSVIADAQDRGLAAHNAVRERGRGRKGKKQSKRQQKPKLKVGTDIPSPEEMRAILNAAGPRAKPFLMMAALAGLRASELRGLIWGNVDLDHGVIHVRQRADRFNQIDAPKSKAGERDVPIPPMLVQTLKEWKLACPRPYTGDKRDANGQPIREKHRPEHYIFPNGIGKIESLPNIIARILIPTMMAAGVTKMVQDVVTAKYTGAHSFRHFFTSWCINRPKDGGLGLPPKIVQERLGHASIILTMDRYGHLFKADDSEELATAEKALLG
jgi:integrase